MLIPDHETELDFLNYEAISKTVVSVIKAHRLQPLTIGIHGDWGAGKSSILRMIESDLKTDSKVACLWFNGWTFEGFEDAKTVFIQAAISELCKQRSTTGKVKEFGSKLLKRIDWLKLAKKGAGLAINLAGLPTPDQIEKIADIIKATTANIANSSTEEIQARLNEISEYIKPSEPSENVPDAVHAFREEFAKLLEEAKIDQLIIFIDDLDRCLPETAIQTLEAIRLFLFVPKTAFIIGADEAMIEYAVRQHFPDMPMALGGMPYARSYLEKLVQVPFRIPALGIQETRAYVTLSLVQNIVGSEHEGFNKLLTKTKESLNKSWLGVMLSQQEVQEVDGSRRAALDEAFIISQQIAPILAEGAKGNPRQIKRFLNAVQVRQLIAKERGFLEHIKQPVLAKLMLAERFQPEFYDFIAARAVLSKDGIVSEIADMEVRGQLKLASEVDVGVDAKKATKEKAESEPMQEIRKWLERDWIKRWLKIEPTLAIIDMRPYVFVAKERLIVNEALILGSLDVLLAKLSGSQLQVKSADSEIKALSEPDIRVLFNMLRERIFAKDDLATPPPGVGGLFALAKHHPALQFELVSLFRAHDPKKLGIWVVKGWAGTITDPKCKKELGAMIEGWANQDENIPLKNAASAAIPALKVRGPNGHV